MSATTTWFLDVVAELSWMLICVVGVVGAVGVVDVVVHHVSKYGTTYLVVVTRSSRQ